MAYKEVLRVDISEVIRRWQAGISQRQIASGTGLSRETVGKYIAAAEEMGVFRDGLAPTEEQLSRLAATSRPGPQQASIPSEEKLAPWADQIYQWLTVDRFQLTCVQELLVQRGSPVFVSLAASLRGPPQLAGTPAEYGVDGRECAGRGDGDRFRTAGSDTGP